MNITDKINNLKNEVKDFLGRSGMPALFTGIMATGSAYYPQIQQAVVEMGGHPAISSGNMEKATAFFAMGAVAGAAAVAIGEVNNYLVNKELKAKGLEREGNVVETTKPGLFAPRTFEVVQENFANKKSQSDLQHGM